LLLLRFVIAYQTNCTLTLYSVKILRRVKITRRIFFLSHPARRQAIARARRQRLQKRQRKSLKKINASASRAKNFRTTG